MIKQAHIKVSKSDVENVKKLLCQSKQPIVRICGSRCKNQESGLCNKQKCKCYKSHENCLEFINADYINNLIREFNKLFADSFFASILSSIEKLIGQSIKIYNNLIDKYLTYGLPKQLSEFKNILSSNGNKVVHRQKASNLKNFIDKYPNFQIKSKELSDKFKESMSQTIAKLDTQSTKYIQLLRKIEKEMAEKSADYQRLILEQNDQNEKKLQMQRGSNQAVL